MRPQLAMLIEQIQPATHDSGVSLRRLAPALALIVLCLPSLLFVWHNRDVPHFGILQDDGLYLIDGKSLAEGSAGDPPLQSLVYPQFLELRKSLGVK